MTASLLLPCRRHDALVSAGRGPASWPGVLARFAEDHDLTFARIEALVAPEGSDGVGARVPVHASAAFVARWRLAHGGDDPALDADDGRRVRWVETETAGRDAASGDPETPEELWIAIDGDVGFVCLHIGAARPLPASEWLSRLAPCLAALSEAVTLGMAIARAEEEVLLRVLVTVGAMGAIVDASGRPRRWEPRERPFDPRFVATLIGRDGASARRRARRSRGAGDRFHLLESGEGRRWIGYAIELPIGETAFMAGDRLLVAWPLDAGPLPVPEGATSGEDLARDLAGAFGLSGAEASLAARLADCDLRQAAERCGIGYETARSHLKSIFRRIGLTRQSELTALLTRFVFHADLRRGLSAANEARIDPNG